MEDFGSRITTRTVLAGCVISLFCCGLIALIIAVVVTVSSNTGLIISPTPTPTSTLTCPFFTNQPPVGPPLTACGQALDPGTCFTLPAPSLNSICRVSFFTGGTTSAPIEDTEVCEVASSTCAAGCRCAETPPRCARTVTVGGVGMRAVFACT